MAYTQDDLDKLKAAIATGALMVEYADKKVTYRSLKDMLTTKDIIESELGITANKVGGRRYAQFGKGFD